jgi:hypothetical protein
MGGDAGLQVKGDTQYLVHQKRDHRKKAVGLISREESQLGYEGDRFAEFNRRHQIGAIAQF